MRKIFLLMKSKLTANSQQLVALKKMLSSYNVCRLSYPKAASRTTF